MLIHGWNDQYTNGECPYLCWTKGQTYESYELILSDLGNILSWMSDLYHIDLYNGL